MVAPGVLGELAVEGPKVKEGYKFLGKLSNAADALVAKTQEASVTKKIAANRLDNWTQAGHFFMDFLIY